MEESVSGKAIAAVCNSRDAYCKFLSANDSGETGGHQAGYLVSNSAVEMMFSKDEIKNSHILKRYVKICWQDDFQTDSCFTWYESKGELRITQFGKGFLFRGPDYTGALFVFTRESNDYYKAYILNTEEDIQQFLDYFGLTPAETNCPIDNNRISSEILEKQVIDSYIGQLKVEFPQSAEMSRAARQINEEIKDDRQLVTDNPDKILIEWIQEEYSLFRAIEIARYGHIVRRGFDTVDEFIN